MKNRKHATLFAAALAITLPILTDSAFADRGTRDPGVNARQANQRARIGQGVSSGELTRNETRSLAREQREIRQEERAYKSDGVLTREERKDLHQDQREASKHIYQEKHDGDKRAGTGNPATRDPVVNARQANQRARIGEGVRSGELTRDERKELVQEQHQIRQEERAYKSDGVLTRDERKNLRQDQNAASKNIYEEKHDAEKR
jgi:hypothetical protein